MTKDSDMQGIAFVDDLLADRLLDDSGAPSGTIVAVGAPCAGKTSFALQAVLHAMTVYGDDRVVMTVSNRKTADRLADRVVRTIGTSSQARPVTTLSAVAFRIIAAVRERSGLVQPRLLNGAEQDTLLRRVMAVHLRHAVMGDDCATCALLRDYFAVEDWSRMVADTAVNRRDDAVAGERADRDKDSGHTRQEDHEEQAATSETMFLRGINDAFIVQLRDMLSRMNELGISHSQESQILDRLGEQGPYVTRLRVQWRLAFALRAEYMRMTDEEYPDEYRLDSSRLLVEGAALVNEALQEELPRVLVVDDFQDLTLAGLSFMESLLLHGCKVVAVGNPDESVQAFRGSYPDYLFDRMRDDPFRAVVLRLELQHDHRPSITRANRPVAARRIQAPHLAALIASRISLSIRATQEDDTPLPQRPGKLPWYDRALPIAPVGDTAMSEDRSVSHGLYRSANEEMDDVVWHIKKSHLAGKRSWNDCAVIAHDNATVRAFGERLRRDGVPVRYSSVTKPLKDEPFVRGLFALIELAQIRNRDPESIAPDSLRALAAFVRSRVRMLMDSPLVTLDGWAGGEPARLSVVETAMKSLGALATVIEDAVIEHAVIDHTLVDDAVIEHADTGRQTVEPTGASDDADNETHDVAGNDVAGNDAEDHDAAGNDAIGNEYELRDRDAAVPNNLAVLVALWHQWLESLGRRSRRQTQGNDNTAAVMDSVEVDDHLVDGSTGFDRSFGIEALYLLLAFNGYGDTHADRILQQICAVAGNDPHSTTFAHLWQMVDEVARGLAALRHMQPQYALSVAWQACHVAERWQRIALDNTDDGRAANDRLDMAMRLFEYAEGSGASRDVDGFIEQVRSMRIEADSLAKVAPIDDAVTLTTPAGADGQHWPLVWIVAMQQGVWPNLAARNTMFGGEDLAQIMLYGHLEGAGAENRNDDESFASLLASEQKAFLVAFTRASDQVMVSAVSSDDMVPSDFLYAYIPEFFDRERDARRMSPEDAAGIMESALNLDADPRGLVALARARLARRALERSTMGESDDTLTDDISQDAAAALALLAEQGVDSADPLNWAYLHEGDDIDTGRGGRTPSDGDALAVDRMPAQSVRHDSGPVVSLSPSAVDGLWGCPVCWLLEHRFAGPSTGGVAQSFGTVIHRVAQMASEEGLDRPEYLEGPASDERVSAVTSRMMALYHEQREPLDEDTDAEQRYRAMRDDADAETMLANIARYFVLSNTDGYLQGNAQKFEIGRLERAQCETSFEAVFSLRDILDVCRGTGSMDSMTLDDIYALMGDMVGGWPEGMREDMRVRLSGRIDRLETRVLATGQRRVRLIDYKTGRKKPASSHFINDLQLICYQLGLRFAVGGADAANSAVHEGNPATMSTMSIGQGSAPVAQSELFYMRTNAEPASSRTPESLFQPALFVDGHLNDRAYTPRSYYQKPNLLDVPQLGEQPPDGVSAQAWREFVALRGTQAVWALNMIARVWYAAGAIRSHTLTAHPTSEHRSICRLSAVCPACAGYSDTIFDMRKA